MKKKSFIKILEASSRLTLKHVLRSRYGLQSQSGWKGCGKRYGWLRDVSHVSPSDWLHSSLYNIGEEDKQALLGNSGASNVIRVLSRREVNKMRRQGIVIHVLGGVEKVSQREMLKKAQKFAPLSDIRVESPLFFTPPIKIELCFPTKPKLFKTVKQQGKIALGPRGGVQGTFRGGGFRAACTPGSGSTPSGMGGVPTALGGADGGSAGAGHESGFTAPCLVSAPRLEQMVYTLIHNQKEKIDKQKKSISEARLSLDREDMELDNMKSELEKMEEVLEEIKKGEYPKQLTQKVVEEAVKKEASATLSASPSKLLLGKLDDRLLLETMTDATETVLGPDHLLMEGNTKWQDYHVAICLQFFLYINHYGNPNLLYGLCSKYFNYFKPPQNATLFPTLHTYRQYNDVLRKLVGKDFGEYLKEEHRPDMSIMIGRISLRQWYHLYWRLEGIFDKHIGQAAEKAKTEQEEKKGKEGK